jgi:hypothetical protein
MPEITSYRIPAPDNFSAVWIGFLIITNQRPITREIIVSNCYMVVD